MASPASTRLIVASSNTVPCAVIACESERPWLSWSHSAVASARKAGSLSRRLSSFTPSAVWMPLVTSPINARKNGSACSRPNRLAPPPNAPSAKPPAGAAAAPALSSSRDGVSCRARSWASASLREPASSFPWLSAPCTSRAM